MYTTFFDINIRMSTIQNTNYLQPSGFRLSIDRKNYPHLEYFVQAVDHPSVGLPLAGASYRRIVDVSQIGDKLEFSEVTFDLMLDEEMLAYTQMYSWMQRLVETNYVSPYTRKGEELTSETDISLIILNSANIQQKRITYKNAFPTNLGSVRMESTGTDSPVIVLPVTFKFTYFEII